MEKYIDYLRTERLMRARSINDYRTALRFLSEEIDPMQAEDFSTVNEAIKRIASKRKWSAATTSKNAKCIKNFYAWCTRERVIPFNPFPFHEFKRPHPKRPPYITEKEYLEIIADPWLCLQEVSMLAVLWDCAPRVSELCLMDQSDIDFDACCVHFPEEKTKGGYSDRYVPFTEATGRMLKGHIEMIQRAGIKEAVWINKWWNRLDPRDVSEMITKIGLRRRQGREALRLTPHMFRHSFGIRMIKEGVPEIVVQKWLGHASLSMTSHYVSMDKDSSILLFKKLVRKEA